MANATAVSPNGYSASLVTTRQRRAAVRRILNALDEIMDKEIQYRDNIPDGLLGSNLYETSDYRITLLDEAIEVLESVYYRQT